MFDDVKERWSCDRNRILGARHSCRRRTRLQPVFANSPPATAPSNLCCVRTTCSILREPVDRATLLRHECRAPVVPRALNPTPEAGVLPDNCVYELIERKCCICDAQI